MIFIMCLWALVTLVGKLLLVIGSWLFNATISAWSCACMKIGSGLLLLIEILTSPITTSIVMRSHPVDFYLNFLQQLQVLAAAAMLTFSIGLVGTALNLRR